MGTGERDDDVYGWKGVADAIGVSVRTAQDWAESGSDPMPISVYGGRIRAEREELLAWARRRLRPWIRRSA